MQKNMGTVVRVGEEAILATNKVIKNTYILLSMTLLFSAFTAYLAVITNAPNLGFLTLIGYFGLFFLVNALRNSSMGVLAVFALTGFMGYTLAPMINAILQFTSNGGEIVAAALGLTGAIFRGLSGYALSTRKDFSYLGGFLFVGITVAFLASLAGLFFQVPALHLAISCAFVLISSGYILFETSQIIHGGERNYIMATVALYVHIYNLFVSLLHILTALSGRND